MSDLTTHDVLTAAKAYLMRYGWQKGDYGGYGGPACLVGALATVRDKDPTEVGESDPTYRALSHCLCTPSMVVESFNDDPGTTFEQAIALLDRAIVATAPAETPVEEPVLA